MLVLHQDVAIESGEEDAGVLWAPQFPPGHYMLRLHLGNAEVFALTLKYTV
jgi:hypothetical protein